MGRYADVDFLIDELKKHNPGEEYEKFNWNTKWLVGFLDDCPKADVKKVVHAEWIEEDGYQTCSNCGDEHCWKDYRASYCESCGAKMKDTRNKEKAYNSVDREYVDAKNNYYDVHFHCLHFWNPWRRYYETHKKRHLRHCLCRRRQYEDR